MNIFTFKRAGGRLLIFVVLMGLLFAPGRDAQSQTVLDDLDSINMLNEIHERGLYFCLTWENGGMLLYPMWADTGRMMGPYEFYAGYYDLWPRIGWVREWDWVAYSVSQEWVWFDFSYVSDWGADCYIVRLLPQAFIYVDEQQ